MTERVVVAVDGPSGSGKSTVARRVADVLGYRYLDTGALYRAVALAAKLSGIDTDDVDRLEGLIARIRIEFTGDTVLLDGCDVTEEIRTPEVSRLVSMVAAVPVVRDGIAPKQRGAWPGEPLVVEGRDIGSVVFPDALVKVYLTAAAEERARRRAAETGRPLAEVLEDLRERDERDSGREHSPLVRVPGAVVLDTTGLGIEEVVGRLVQLIRSKTGT